MVEKDGVKRRGNRQNETIVAAIDPSSVDYLQTRFRKPASDR